MVGVIGVDIIECGCIFMWNLYVGYCCVGIVVDVELDYLFGIYMVDVVGVENYYVVWIFVVD